MIAYLLTFSSEFLLAFAWCSAFRFLVIAEKLVLLSASFPNPESEFITTQLLLDPEKLPVTVIFGPKWSLEDCTFEMVFVDDGDDIEVAIARFASGLIMMVEGGDADDALIRIVVELLDDICEFFKSFLWPEKEGRLQTDYNHI